MEKKLVNKKRNINIHLIPTAKQTIGFRKLIGYMVLTGCMTFLDYIAICNIGKPMFISKHYIIAFAIFCGLNIFDQNKEKVKKFLKNMVNGDNTK